MISHEGPTAAIDTARHLRFREVEPHAPGTFALPPIPDDDEQRVDDLRRLDLMLTTPEEAFDRITRDLARVFDVSGVVLSFIDEDTLYIKSALGLSPELERDRTEPRELAVCSHVVGDNEMMVVEDLLADDRFRENPMVVESGARFYAGAPLRAESGRAIGSLCIVDSRPRAMAEREQNLLRLITEGAMAQIALHAATRQLLARTKEVERDLRLARQVQRFALPPARLEGNGWRISHLYRPVEYVGGDFIDVELRPDGRWAILVADVAGHGASAALTAAMAKTAFLRGAGVAGSAGELLTTINHELFGSVLPGGFMTALAVLFDPRRRRVEIASAGHPHPLLVSRMRTEPVRHDNDIPLLIDRDTVYERQTTLELPPGDGLLVYTDGAIDAADAQGRRLHPEGLRRLAREVARERPDDFLEALFTRIARRARGRLGDDVALLKVESLERA